MNLYLVRNIFATALTVSALATLSISASAQGIYFRGMGAVNESMAGAGIAAPLDAAGAIYTNPAGISALPRNEITFGVGALEPNSSVDARYIGGAAQLYGGDHHINLDSKQDIYVIPSFAVSRHVGDWTFGCLIGAVGGASANYHGSNDPYAPLLGTYGKRAEAKVFELIPTVAYKANDWISVGGSLVAGCFSLKVDPMPFNRFPSATAAHPDGGPLYHSKTEYTFGVGANFGVLFDLNQWAPGVKTGLVVKTPVWAPAFEFDGATTAGADGLYRETQFEFGLPLTVGWGASYQPHKNWLFALDVRYFDYEDTPGFGPTNVIDSGGKVHSLGWQNIVSVALGVQYTINDDWKVRAGYCWNENPTPGSSQFANVSSPLFIQHVASVGVTYSLRATETDFTVAWTHAFTSKCAGDYNGAIAVENSVGAETLFFAITQKF